MGTHRAVERAARDSKGRRVVFLAARSRDIAAGEDPLAGAFLAALETWPLTGVPEKPEAWLLTGAGRGREGPRTRARPQPRAAPADFRTHNDTRG